MTVRIRNIIGISYCRYYSTTKRVKKLPIISCKRPEFNHYPGQCYDKFKGIKLASDGWSHRKSKGDYFVIHLNVNENGSSSLKTASNKSFVAMGLCKELSEVMLRLGYKLPSVIQSKCFNTILKGNNTALTAETGCGKTLAYLLPIMQHILEWKPSVEEKVNSPLAVVITPSRELAIQIGEVSKKIGEGLNINVSTFVGGHTKRKLMNPPVEYCDILVSSVGVLSKLMTNEIIKIHNVHHVVLDEADTLLDDSFIEKVSHVLKKFPIQYKVDIQVPPRGCQLTLVSATLPHELPEAVSSFVEPESICTISTEKIHRILGHVPQKFIRLGKAQKPIELLKLVQADVNSRRPVMIFSNKSDTCDFVSLFLNENGIECLNLNKRMHVDIQEGRFAKFVDGSVNVLSVTDIGSRGLDTTRAQHIINYDFPHFTADYIHRAGRTGRIGSPGSCLVTNFVSSTREINLVKRIETSIRKDGALPSVNANIKRQIEDRITKMSLRF